MKLILWREMDMGLVAGQGQKSTLRQAQCGAVNSQHFDKLSAAPSTVNSQQSTVNTSTSSVRRPQQSTVNTSTSSVRRHQQSTVNTSTSSVRRPQQFKNIVSQICLGILLPLALFGCSQGNESNNSQGNGKPQVVATSTIIADLTQEIGGDEVEVKGILKPGTDPHVYEPVPADSRVMETAKLILYNGYNLEPGLIKLMNAAGGKVKRLAVGEVVKPLQLDKGKGEVVPDPHVWGSAENAIAMVNAIRDGLIELSPSDKDKFTQNASELTTELKQLHSWIQQQIQTIPPDKRKLVTTHDAFQYYGNAYKIAIAGTLIGISTEEQPSAQTVQRLVESINKIGVNAIFAETTINPALIKTVAQEAGVKLAPRQLYSDSIGAKGSDGDTYIKMMEANTHTIVEALEGKYTPFKSSK